MRKKLCLFLMISLINGLGLLHAHSKPSQPGTGWHCVHGFTLWWPLVPSKMLYNLYSKTYHNNMTGVELLMLQDELELPKQVVEYVPAAFDNGRFSLRTDNRQALSVLSFRRCEVKYISSFALDPLLPPGSACYVMYLKAYSNLCGQWNWITNIWLDQYKFLLEIIITVIIYKCPFVCLSVCDLTPSFPCQFWWGYA